MFLPAAGSRNGEALEGQGKYGHYWAKDCINQAIAFNVRFSPAGTNGYNAFGRYAGYAVRLVCETSI